jgi:hypothetical protein
MGILGEIWDKIPVAGIIGRRNRHEEKKINELKNRLKR